MICLLPRKKSSQIERKIWIDRLAPLLIPAYSYCCFLWLSSFFQSIRQKKTGLPCQKGSLLLGLANQKHTL